MCVRARIRARAQNGFHLTNGAIADRHGLFRALIERAFKVVIQREAHQNADHSRDRHRDDHPDKAEQRPEGREREDQPQRMQPDRGADEFGRDDIALKELPDGENPGDNANADPIAPELEQRQTDRQHPADDRTNVR